MAKEWRLIIVLTVIALVSGAILGLVNVWTEPVIKEQEALAKQKSLQQALPEAAEFRAETALLEELPPDETTGITELYRGFRAEQPVGFVFILNQRGYASGIQMAVGVTQEGKLAGINIISQGETPGLGARVTDEEFLNQQAFREATVKRQLAVTKDQGKVEAITNATVSSRAVVRGVNAALAAARSLLAAEKEMGGALQ
ncbi:MAG TPA: RnfABCDGE type electron transport complex subunit G [Capillibacterium sp.]